MGKLIVGFLSNSPELISQMKQRLIHPYGPLESESALFSFLIALAIINGRSVPICSVNTQVLRGGSRGSNFPGSRDPPMSWKLPFPPKRHIGG